MANEKYERARARARLALIAPTVDDVTAAYFERQVEKVLVEAKQREEKFPAGDGDRPGRRGAQQHRHHAGERNDHRDGIHPVRGPVHLHARRAPALRGGVAGGD